MAPPTPTLERSETPRPPDRDVRDDEPHARRHPDLRRGREHPHRPPPGAHGAARRRHPRRRRQQPGRHRRASPRPSAPSSVASPCSAGSARTGSARRTAAGFAFGLARGYAVLVEMDADLSHDPAALPRLVGALDGGADLAIGSRYVAGAAIPDWSARRRALSRYGNRYAGFVLGAPIRDLTSGYRAYRADALRCGARRDHAVHRLRVPDRARAPHHACRPHGGRGADRVQRPDRGRLQDVELDHPRSPRPGHLVGPARPHAEDAPRHDRGAPSPARGRDAPGRLPPARRAAPQPPCRHRDPGARRDRRRRRGAAALGAGTLEAQLRRILHRHGGTAPGRDACSRSSPPTTPTRRSTTCSTRPSPASGRTSSGSGCPRPCARSRHSVLLAAWLRPHGRVAVIATALVALSAFQIAHGRDARMYAELEVLGVGVAFLTDRWLRAPQRHHAPLLAALVLAGLYTHVSMFLLAAGLLTVAGLRRDREAWRWRGRDRRPRPGLGGDVGPALPRPGARRSLDVDPVDDGRDAHDRHRPRGDVPGRPDAGGRHGDRHRCGRAVPAGPDPRPGLDRVLRRARRDRGGGGTRRAGGAGPHVHADGVGAGGRDRLPRRRARSTRRWAWTGAAIAAVAAVLLVPDAWSVATSRTGPSAPLTALDRRIRPGDVVAVRPASKAPELQWSLGGPERDGGPARRGDRPAACVRPPHGPRRAHRAGLVPELARPPVAHSEHDVVRLRRPVDVGRHPDQLPDRAARRDGGCLTAGGRRSRAPAPTRSRGAPPSPHGNGRTDRRRRDGGRGLLLRECRRPRDRPGGVPGRGPGTVPEARRPDGRPGNRAAAGRLRRSRPVDTRDRHPARASVPRPADPGPPPGRPAPPSR